MSWWQSRSGLVESLKLALAAIVVAVLALACLYWLTTLGYHALFH